MTEIEFEQRIVDLAHQFGWRVPAFRPARTKDGHWVTPVKYDGKGWPDLVLVHPEHGVLFREIKVDDGRLRPEQLEWLDLLTRAGADAKVWRPIHWPQIVELLSGGRAAA